MAWVVLGSAVLVLLTSLILEHSYCVVCFGFRILGSMLFLLISELSDDDHFWGCVVLFLLRLLILKLSDGVICFRFRSSDCTLLVDF